jgi:acetyltransferase-like isoleucine patch superfamily enzyme
MKPVISPHIRVRYPEALVVGDDSIIDDFCYFSTKVRIGCCSHIAAGCTIAGGRERQFTLGDFSSVSSGVRIWCTSDDFRNDLVTILPPGLHGLKEHLISGDVTFESMTAVGANAVVMPDNHVPEGTVIGALALVPPGFPFQPWSVYAGIPIRQVGDRNRDRVLAQARRLQEYLRERGPHD